MREGGCGCEVGGEREEGVAAAGLYVETERQGTGKRQGLEAWREEQEKKVLEGKAVELKMQIKEIKAFIT